MRRLLAALAVLLVAVVGLAPPASAHAQLVSTNPSNGAVLDEAPSTASVRFNEGVEADGDSVQLHDADGERVVTGAVRRSDGGRTLTLPLDDLGDGGYILTWRVVSLDGHPISGGVTWRVGARSQAVDPSLFAEILSAEEGDTLVSGAAAVVRALLFGSLLVLVGGVAFLLLVSPEDDRRLRRLLRAALGVATVLTVVSIGVQGADVSGQSLSTALRPGTIGDTLDTAFGQWALVRLVPLAVLAALLVRFAPRMRWWQVAAGVASTTAMFTLSMAGHARTGRWSGLALPLDVVHLLAAATWIGGLVVLFAVVLPKATDDRAARRFSSVATVAVGVVVVTGALQGFRQLDGLGGLRETTYGRLLVLKVVAVAILAVLGAMSRSLVRATDLTPEDLDDDEEPLDPVALRRALRRSVGLEALVAVVIVALTSLLVAADPGHGTGNSGFSGQKVVQSTLVEVSIAPGQAGPVDVHVYTSDPTFGLTTELEADVTMTLPDGTLPAITVPVRPAGRGHWSAYGFEVPVAGRWRMDVVVTVGQFEQRQASFFFDID